MIGGHARGACPPIIYKPGLTIQATLTNADYAGNVSLTEIVPDFGRHLRKCPMLSALAGRWCGGAAPTPGERRRSEQATVLAIRHFLRMITPGRDCRMIFLNFITPWRHLN